MTNFSLTKLEIKSGKNMGEDDDTVYSLLKKLYKGRINFGIIESGFRGLLIWKSSRYMNLDGQYVTVYDVKEY